MRLEDQVVSLELAKKLKELGVKQESFAYWVNTDDFPTLHYKGLCTGGISAFTVAELEPMLPSTVNIAYKNGKPRRDGHWLKYHRGSAGVYWVAYRHSSYDSSTFIDMRGDTFADAFAKMLVHLIENKLMTV